MDEKLNKQDIEVQEVSTPQIKTFQDLLMEMHVILEDAKKVIVSYNQRLIELKEKENRLSLDRNSIIQRENNIRDRESACEKIENVIELRRSSQILMDEANKRLDSAKKAEADLSLHMQEENSKLKETRISVQKEYDNLQRQRKELDNIISDRVQEVLKNMKK